MSPAPGTVAPLPAHIYARCPHGMQRLLFERCGACDDEDETRALAERRRVHCPAQRIVDRIAERRRWFERCAFCAPRPDLVQERYDHDPQCPWLTFLRSGLRPTSAKPPVKP